MGIIKWIVIGAAGKAIFSHMSNKPNEKGMERQKRRESPFRFPAGINQLAFDSLCLKAKTKCKFVYTLAEILLNGQPPEPAGVITLPIFNPIF